MTTQKSVPKYKSLSLTPAAIAGLQRLTRQLSAAADRRVTLAETLDALLAAQASYGPTFFEDVLAGIPPKR